jgi:hypothetical protein
MGNVLNQSVKQRNEIIYVTNLRFDRLSHYWLTCRLFQTEITENWLYVGTA